MLFSTQMMVSLQTPQSAWTLLHQLLSATYSFVLSFSQITIAGSYPIGLQAAKLKVEAKANVVASNVFFIVSFPFLIVVWNSVSEQDCLEAQYMQVFSYQRIVLNTDLS